ncbi:hypothetical protein [Streptomyces sp. NPDC003036]|uniref:hypothetical protein n=1 Tax=Streptomyces sp. NPDC003036 TaxID=3154442 RepID=UPI0033AC22EC
MVLEAVGALLIGDLRAVSRTGPRKEEYLDLGPWIGGRTEARDEYSRVFRQCVALDEPTPHQNARDYRRSPPAIFLEVLDG